MKFDSLQESIKIYLPLLASFRSYKKIVKLSTLIAVLLIFNHRNFLFTIITMKVYYYETSAYPSPPSFS